MARPIEFPFILEELEGLALETKPMFGARGVYVDGKIVFILRDRPTSIEDNGVWLATTPEHHASLASEFPSMRSIALFGPGVTGWQVLPIDSEDFEESALRACRLVRSGDPRIGKISARRVSKKPARDAAAKKSSKASPAMKAIGKKKASKKRSDKQIRK